MVLRLSWRLASVVVLAASALVIPSETASADGIPTQVDAAAVDNFIGDGLAAASIPGAAVAITRDDRVLHVRGYGHDAHQVPVTASTLFRIASLSKSFTSLAGLQLVDAGKLSLDDPVAAHVAEFRPADPRGADITVRQLLDQTSGLAVREVSDRNRAQPGTLAEATTSLDSAHLVAAPGTQVNYYNPNYHVAARLVEVLSGETFETYLRTHVLQPAGMSASLTTNTDDQTVSGLADGHVVAYGQPIATPAPGTFVGGAGDVVSTAADMAHWLILHTNGGRAADGTPPRLRAQPQGDPYGKRTERLRPGLGHRRPCRGPDPTGAQREPAHLQCLPGGSAGRRLRRRAAVQQRLSAHARADGHLLRPA